MLSCSPTLQGFVPSSLLSDEEVGVSQGGPPICFPLLPLLGVVVKANPLLFMVMCKGKTSALRITERKGLERGTFKVIQFQPPCYRQGHLLLDQTTQSPIHPGLGWLRWGLHDSHCCHLVTESRWCTVQTSLPWPSWRDNSVRLSEEMIPGGKQRQENMGPQTDFCFLSWTSRMWVI